MDVESFADIRKEFEDRVSSIVWASVATVDTKGRTRARMLHPIWEVTDEGAVGWIATGRQSLKAKHLEGNPHVSLTYWTPEHQQVMADCKTEFIEDMAEKRRLWDLFGEYPEPYGYDLKTFWESVDDPTYGLLKLEPWRVEVWSIQEVATGKPPRVWRPAA